MNLQGLANVIRTNLKHNAPAYLSAGACLGVIGTIILTAKQAPKAVKKVEEWEELNGRSEYKRERIIDYTRVTWRIWAPVVISGGATCCTIVAANKLSKNQTLAAVAGGAMVQRAFDEYKEKVIEQIGVKKHQEIQGKIAEEKVLDNPPPAIIVGDGHVLCCELYTGRYFMSDVESLRKAQNILNNKMLSQDFQTLADFQYLIGLTPTTNSTNIGWRVGRLMELEISAILTSDDRPCLAFDYNYTVPV